MARRSDTKIAGSGKLLCRVVTPQKTVFARRVDSVALETAAGSLEIFARYEPTIAPLAVGSMVTRDEDGQENIIAIHGGYMDMNGNNLVILADSAEVGDEINVDRAREALTRARNLLGQVTEEGRSKGVVDIDRARLAIMRALARLKVAGADAPPGRDY